MCTVSIFSRLFIYMFVFVRVAGVSVCGLLKTFCFSYSGSQVVCARLCHAYGLLGETKPV